MGSKSEYREVEEGSTDGEENTNETSSSSSSSSSSSNTATNSATDSATGSSAQPPPPKTPPKQEDGDVNETEREAIERLRRQKERLAKGSFPAAEQRAGAGAASSSGEVCIEVGGVRPREPSVAERRDARPEELRRARKGVMFVPDEPGRSEPTKRKPVSPSTHFFSPSVPSSQAGTKERATGEKQKLRSGSPGDTFSTPFVAETGHSVEERVIAKAEKQKHGYLMWTISVLQLIALGFMVINEGLAPICVSGGDCNPFIGPKPGALRDWGAKDSQLIRDSGEWWRFFTPIFLHAGFVHLLSNLAFQLRAGADMECLWGWWRVAAIYFISGVGGNVISAIVAPETLSVGASGSLFGLLGSMFSELTMNWRFMHKPGKQLVSLLIMTVIVIAVGMLPMIDQFVHLGGLVFGFLVGFLFVPKTKARLVPYILRFIGTGLAVLGFVTAFTIFYEKPDYHCSVCLLLNPWGADTRGDEEAAAAASAAANGS